MTSTTDPAFSGTASQAGSSRLKRSADVLWSAAKDVRTAVNPEDAIADDTRDAVDSINRALGELATTAALLEKSFARSGLRSRELELRSQELVASLLGARRNGELVTRHLPRARREGLPPLVP